MNALGYVQLEYRTKSKRHLNFLLAVRTQSQNLLRSQKINLPSNRAESTTILLYQRFQFRERRGQSSKRQRNAD